MRPDLCLCTRCQHCLPVAGNQSKHTIPDLSPTWQHRNKVARTNLHKHRSRNAPILYFNFCSIKILTCRLYFLEGVPKPTMVNSSQFMLCKIRNCIYRDVIMSAMASQIVGVSIVIQPFVRVQIKENIKVSRHWLFEGNPPVTGGSPHKGPVTRKIFTFDDVTMMLTTHTVVVCLGWLHKHILPAYYQG